MTTDTSTTDILRFAAVGLLLAWALWKNHRNRRYLPVRLRSLAAELHGEVVSSWFRPRISGTMNGRAVTLRWPFSFSAVLQEMVVEYEVATNKQGRVRRSHVVEDLRRLGASDQRLSFETTRLLLEHFSRLRGSDLRLRDGKAVMAVRREWDEAALANPVIPYDLAVIEVVVGIVDPRPPSGSPTT